MRIVGTDYSTPARQAGISERERVVRSRRLYAIGGIVVLWGALVVWRLLSLQVFAPDTWDRWAQRQQTSEISLASERGTIVDREGRLLAVSVPAESLWIRPREVTDAKRTAAQLAMILSRPAKEIEDRLVDNRPFVWLARQIPRGQAERVMALNLRGVGSVSEAKRVYPYSEAASTLIGRVGLDGTGLSGIERSFESRLAGKNRELSVQRDALGKVIDVDVALEPEMPRGDSLRLTLDASLQLIMEEELAKGRQDAHAKRAYAVLMDAQEGDILGMSQYPSANFNSAGPQKIEDLHNLVLETAFEPGSIMKPLVAAAAIDAGVTRSTDMYDCENGRYTYGGHTIRDVHPSQVVSLYDVVVRSSNIGMTKVGMRLGEHRLYQALTSYGFGQLSGLGLAGETRGILRPLDSWSKVDVATHSFGQGVAVTPLQMVRAVSAIVNGGVLPPLRLVAGRGSQEYRRILSPKSAAAAREMMFGVVEDEHGTGHKATIPGVRIGGKTGTAQKARADGRGYEPNSYVASFVGFADSRAIGLNRQLSLVVIIDEPESDSIYGGVLAAPVFQRIMQRVLHQLSTTQPVSSRSADIMSASYRADGTSPLPGVVSSPVGIW